ncbi:23S rRNA (adenine(2030)-N(6))-methyltransferase RlmJ [Fulvimarina sp. 2208YS6-2-32]|uniref:Ribosomal RNA large subunit methyltransferase J n=1 Tax=Fulvimarina uroteuthidis TaxID=3098149 RepID=A0ABU5I304_9HYPH|nr:23S rRNA (adenine(2030)-N(6))-methyltransferase RlmJ [Fulvimarina sp. 2208YS6-2-32]MDY8109742.1 23S rRNA (adenine(2030)-N(6))-methyltransferase RlmJ [Fulvimarina sp. 2208YS6-2-32]
MNYRHAYHAGNFADVVKHALLVRLIAYLKRKDKAFRVYDTHAGRGRYDLKADEALRTGEAHAGILRLAADPDLRGEPLFADYFAAIEADLAEGFYPGSPLIARRCLRAIDRLSAYELHPKDGEALRHLFAGDIQTKAMLLDGWLALGAHLPPKEKRGLVLIDPPFEKTSEVDDILAGLDKALGRWRGGIYAVWYPIKKKALAERLLSGIRALAPDEALAVEARFESEAQEEERFVGTGLAVINPPYLFAGEAETIVNRLVPALKRDKSATGSVFALT